MEMQRSEHSQRNLKKKNVLLDSCFLIFNTSCETAVLKKMCYCLKDN